MIILSPNLVAFNCIWILYGGLDAWPIHTEIPGMTLLAFTLAKIIIIYWTLIINFNYSIPFSIIHNTTKWKEIFSLKGTTFVYPNIKVDIWHPDVGWRCIILPMHLCQLKAREIPLTYAPSGQELCRPLVIFHGIFIEIPRPNDGATSGTYELAPLFYVPCLVSYLRFIKILSTWGIIQRYCSGLFLT
jgi:hypothetical protein